jgi:putative flippase GtrA
MGTLLLSSQWLDLSDIVSTLIAMVFFTGPNYLGNRIFTFRPHRAA